MDFFENRYYKFNRLLLITVGLWPYQHWRKRLIIAAPILVLLLMSGSLLILKFFKTVWTINFVSYSLQYIVPSILMITNLCYCFFNNEKIKAILEHIKFDWTLLQPCDVKIIAGYAEVGRFYTLFLITFTGVGIVSQLAKPLVLSQTANKQDSNGTEDSHLPFPIDIPYIDQRKYFGYVICYFLFSVSLGTIVTLGCSTFYLCNIQHACGMFNIAGQRLETMFDDIENIVVYREEHQIVKVYRGVMFHSRTIEFVDIVNSLFAPLYLTQTLLLTLDLSCDIMQEYKRGFDLGSVACISNIFVIFTAISVFMYSGQVLLDHSNDIFTRVYFSRWYVAPKEMQNLLLLVMIRSLKLSGITLTKSLTASVEMLAGVLKLSVSYFMAMNSLQE